MKKILFLLPVLFLASCVVTHQGYGYDYPVYVLPGVGLGTVVAVVVSWSRNKSIFWAIIHGLLGWLYVLYAIIVKK
jgi:hypothetical protein